MKTKIIILSILFLCIVLITNAQPLPPTTPQGNPVPAEGLLALLPLALLVVGVLRLRKKKEH